MKNIKPSEPKEGQASGSPLGNTEGNTEAENRSKIERENNELQKKLRARSELLYMVAAELRTPLTIITNAVEENTIPVNESEKQTILASTRQLMDLMREQTSKQVKTEQMPIKRTIRLGEIRKELLARLLPAAQKNQMALVCSVPENTSADISQVHLSQILDNLILNAIKYSPPKTRVAVNIKAHAGKLIVTVDDEGCGVPQSDRNRIFEPFIRINSDMHIPGSGLGLATVKNIAEQYKGTVWVEPRLPRGSRFVATLHVPIIFGMQNQEASVPTTQ